jgi:hypothetical protein
LFTRTFRKPALVCATLCTIGALGLLLLSGLNALATWAERDLDAYPFMQEDWLRYLVPTKFVQDGSGRILLTGPSTVRENLLYERFEAEFPGQVIVQGGISLGTIDDATAALNYIEAAYGSDALPTTVVMGISPRFIANIPDDRPLKDGIDSYSPYFSATRSDAGIVLAPKGMAESLLSRARFLLNKAPDRYRTAIFALVSHLLAGNTASPHNDDGKSVAQERVDRFFRQPAVRRLFAGTRFRRALDHDFTEVLAWLASPYKYRLDPPAGVSGLIKWMDGEDSWWQDVHSWDPRQTAQATRASLERFNALVRKHGMELYVVNMPERDVSRARYRPDIYAAYLELVRNTLDNAHFLDLQEFLRTEEFHDLEHSRYPGSLRLTDRIIAFMKNPDEAAAGNPAADTR